MLALIKDDPWLEPYEKDIQNRIDYFQTALSRIKDYYGTLHSYAEWDLEMGFIKTSDGYIYREWAPAAQALSLIGDFNDWDAGAHQLNHIGEGIWEVFVPFKDGLQHMSKVKVKVTTSYDALDRIPAFIQYATQDTQSYDFVGRIWEPDQKFEWSDEDFEINKQDSLLIYEAHIGMAQNKEGVGSLKEFEQNVLPRIKALGYNAIQLMAIAEHPYYGSFGYHVSNFYAPSSRFGTPDDLKSLINTAHNNGIAVIMDVVHSHAVKNIAEGLNNFDGSDNQYFHSGGRGYHNAWDSKLFDYSKNEVRRFLLSNLRYWLEDFHFDGFRFDGVTSMLYHHHGDHVSFDHYDKYFKDGVDWDAVCYLQLANSLIHELKLNAISIAEDMSGMPGCCRDANFGGLGFDYRLGMGIPDHWIKLLKHQRDEEWNMDEIWSMLTNRRHKEKTVAYAESHDQAMVGDKSIAFWLMDKDMYWHMAKENSNLVIERGLALHKMIRLITAAAGGDAYMNFIGNEFGHPEWIDFPRAGNDWSYKYAKRQWNLVDNKELLYHYLSDFDRDMVRLLQKYELYQEADSKLLNVDQKNNTIIFKRADLIFVFNFHPNDSIADYRFWVPEAGKYEYVLNSDDSKYGGFNRVDTSIKHETIQDENHNFLSIYNTNRSAFILKKIN